MNAAAADSVRWSARRWIYSIAAVFALQAGLLLYLGQHEQPAPARPTFRTAIHFVTDPWSSEQLARLPAMTDPTLSALPGEQGFAGAAWRRVTPLDYQAKPWSEDPRWLTLDTASLGGDFARFTATNTITPPLVADKPVPPLLRYEPRFPTDPPPQQSRLRIEGELAARPLLKPLDLRPWPHSDLLSNTIVQVAVNADGHVISPVLLAECGLNTADLRAMELAASARFRPLPRAARDRTGTGPLAWGKLIFHWHTLPITATNPASPQP